MLIVNPKFHRRKYSYGGTGIFDIFKVIFRTVGKQGLKKVISSVGKQGLKKVINKAAKSKIIQKVIESAVDGATSGVKTVVENAIINGGKRKAAAAPLIFKKKAKIGSGIILD